MYKWPQEQLLQKCIRYSRPGSYLGWHLRKRNKIGGQRETEKIYCICIIRKLYKKDCFQSHLLAQRHVPGYTIYIDCFP